MTQGQLEKLEDKINALLARFEKINLENNELRQQVNELRNERDRLHRKNETARKQIDIMISRLKSM